ncbi:MAG: VCBS repeat-containing protein, partial [Candidatus Aegiribacteria sp.]|nr:VCBS repeat-containing protein [Candidatus Aegiribacteria sp.]
MYRSILLLVISGFFINTYADSAVQTDWSGGSWTWDPTGEWGNQFYLETNIEWDSGPGVISLHYNAEHIVDGDFGGASSAYSTDIDGDGDMDVLGAAYQAHHITWWENIDGSGTSWIEHTIDESFDGANSAYSEDIDGDGDMDVLS